MNAVAATPDGRVQLPDAAAGGTDWKYHVALHDPKNARRFPLGAAGDGVLSAALAQVEFQALRRGVAAADSAGLALTHEPYFAAASAAGLIAGVRVRAHGPRGQVQRDFPVSVLFSRWAADAAQPLVKSRALKLDDEVVLEVAARAAPPPVAAAGAAALPEVFISRAPLPIAGTLPRQALLAATPCGVVGDDFPLVLSRELLAKARRLCESPASAEGGAMLVGNLLRLEGEEPDIVGVVHGVLELRHARQTRFGFEPTTKTFADLAAQQQLRRQRLNFPHEVPLVLLHTHPFEPSVRDDGEANCTTCPLQPTCNLTSSFYSSSDIEFHLSMYSATPWTVGMVLGLTPRREEDLRMFCLEGNSVRQRGFYWSP